MLTLLLQLVAGCAPKCESAPPDEPCSETQNSYQYRCDACGVPWVCSSPEESFVWDTRVQIECHCITASGGRSDTGNCAPYIR